MRNHSSKFTFPTARIPAHTLQSKGKVIFFLMYHSQLLLFLSEMVEGLSKLYYREQSLTKRGMPGRYKYFISNFLDSLINNSVS